MTHRPAALLAEEDAGRQTDTAYPPEADHAANPVPAAGAVHPPDATWADVAGQALDTTHRPAEAQASADDAERRPDTAFPPGGDDVADPGSMAGGGALDGSAPGGGRRAAAFFDLDKTIIAKSSTLAFGRPFFHGGLIGRRAVLRASYAQLVYLVAGADEEQMDRMRDYIAALAAGWEVSQVREVVNEALHEVVDPLIYDEAASLIEQHHREGRDVVIVSSSGEEVVGPIGELLGADRVVATRMVIEEGRYTGEIAFYAYGPNKAAAVRELAEAEGYDLTECYAYSDSATDLPLLEAVGRPVAVNPDRTLRRLALQRGWMILRFNRPVSMRSRFAGLRSPSRTMVAGTAVGVGAAAAGIAWYAARRRLRTSRTSA